MAAARKSGGRRSFLALCGAAACCAATRGLAQDAYPARPLRLISSSGAGSGADLLARLVAERFGAGLGQPVLVENKPGANGLLAADLVAKAPADGYMLLFGSASATVVNQAIQPKVAIDVGRDLVPIGQIGSGGIVLVATPDFPATDVREFVAAARSSGGRLDYGSWGIGSTGHLVMEWLKGRVGIDLQHVPYKAVPPLLQDMRGGQIKLAFVDTASAVPLVRSGHIKALGVTGTHRSALLPGLPTFTEQGFRFDVNGWYGLFAPRGTPAAIVETLNRQLLRILSAPDLRARLAEMNAGESPRKSAAEFTQTVRDDLRTWEGIARAHSIRVD